MSSKEKSGAEVHDVLSLFPTIHDEVMDSPSRQKKKRGLMAKHKSPPEAPASYRMVSSLSPRFPLPTIPFRVGNRSAKVKGQSIVRRICHVEVKHIQISEPLPSAVSNIAITVRIRGQKRKYTLRSNAILVLSDSPLDSDLDFAYSLEYNHHLKTGMGNPDLVQIMLEKKNKKSRKYKTIGVTHIGLDVVLQCPMENTDVELGNPNGENQENKITLTVSVSSELGTTPAVLQKPRDFDDEEFEDIDFEEKQYDYDEYEIDTDFGANQSPVGLYVQRHAPETPQNTGSFRHKFEFDDNMPDSGSHENSEDTDNQIEFDSDKNKPKVTPKPLSKFRSKMQRIKQSFSGKFKNLRRQSLNKDDLHSYGYESDGILYETSKSSNDGVYGSLYNRSSRPSHRHTQSAESITLRPRIRTAQPRRRHSFDYIPCSVNDPNSPAKDDGEQGYDSSSDNEPEHLATFSPNPTRHQPTLSERLQQITSMPSFYTSLSKKRKYNFPEFILLLDGQESVSERMVTWSSRSSSDLDMGAYTCTLRNETDAVVAFQTLTAAYKKSQQNLSQGDAIPPLRLCVIGSDTCVANLLRPFVELVASQPRSWEHLKIYIIPAGDLQNPKSNRIAEYLSKNDSIYRGLFFSDMWQQAWDKDTESSWISAVGESIEQAMKQYLFESSSVFRFPIAEALIERDRTDQKQPASPIQANFRVNIPFVRNFEIVSQTQQLQVDFWERRKKNDRKTTLKGYFTFLDVDRMAVLQEEDLNPDKLTSQDYLGQSGSDASLQTPFAPSTSPVGASDTISHGFAADNETVLNSLLLTATMTRSKRDNIMNKLHLKLHMKKSKSHTQNSKQPPPAQEDLDPNHIPEMDTLIDEQPEKDNEFREQKQRERDVLYDCEDDFCDDNTPDEQLSPDQSTHSGQFVFGGSGGHKLARNKYALKSRGRVKRIKNRSWKRGGGKLTNTDSKNMRSIVTKVVCSSVDGNCFSVRIDGSVVEGVTFASISPQITSRNNSFPVSLFRSEFS